MNIDTQKEEPIVTSSSDNDAPAAQDPAPATPAASPPQNPSESTADPADGDDAPEPQPEGEERAPLPKGVQRKINKLTRKAGDAERTARELQLERDLLVERLRNYEKPAPQQPQPKPQEDGKPTLEQFDYDPDRYYEALADWKVDQKLTAERAKVEQRQAQEKAQERFRSLAEKETAFAAEHPDYEEIAKDPSVPITDVMADAIFEADNPPAIAYYLGQHIEEAASIAQMSPVAIGRAIARIEAKVSAPATNEPGQPPRRITNAPPPPTTLNSAAPISKELAELPMDEYAAERTRQRKAQGLA